MFVQHSARQDANTSHFWARKDAPTYGSIWRSESETGESLTPETPLIGYERSKRSGDEFLSTRKITHYIRTAMRAAGVYKRPYVLRAYAETQLIIAESKGKISHPYLQFIAGHKGDIESRYSTNKGRLPPDMIEDMRAQYKACEPFLSTTSK